MSLDIDVTFVTSYLLGLETLCTGFLNVNPIKLDFSAAYLGLVPNRWNQFAVIIGVIIIVLIIVSNMNFKILHFFSFKKYHPTDRFM